MLLYKHKCLNDLISNDNYIFIHKIFFLVFVFDKLKFSSFYAKRLKVSGGGRGVLQNYEFCTPQI